MLACRTVILKGVTIGDNCIVGACSVVNRDIPSNSVAVGNPARVICSIEEYYQKRKSAYVDEAKAYARNIEENLGRDPVQADFWEEFPLFLKRDELPSEIPVKRQMGSAYDHYRKHHEPVFESFEDFMLAAGVSLDKNTPERSHG